MADDTMIGEVTKNAKERLRVRLTEYQGHALCDVRVFAEGETPGIYDRPSHKGVCFNRTLLPQLRELLMRAEVAARTRASKNGDPGPETPEDGAPGRVTATP